MKFQLLIFLTGFSNIIPTHGRLIQKNKTRNVDEVKTDNPNPTIRLTRDIADALSGLSTDDTIQNEEFITSHNKRSKHFYLKINLDGPEIQAFKKSRTIRESIENVKADPVQRDENLNNTIEEPKKVLVKQPIPKYNDNLDNEDFQSEISKSYVIPDTADNEDEDFNVADYDFDVNHDEFITKEGRNHVEPRVNTKHFNTDDTKTANIHRKVNKNGSPLTVSNVKERAADLDSYETDTTPHIDRYDDDDASEETSTKKSVLKDSIRKLQHEEYSDEIDESIENDRTNSSTRTARSWKINLFSDKENKKSLRTVSKDLRTLPMFPQIPDNLHEDFLI